MALTKQTQLRASQVKGKVFSTLQEALSSKYIGRYLGGYISVLDRGADYLVIESTELSSDGFKAFQCTTDTTKSLKIKETGDLYAHNLGFLTNNLLDLQPVLDYCMTNKLNIKVRRAPYVMPAGELRWNPTIHVDFCGSTVTCSLGAKIANKYVEADLGSENSFEGNRLYMSNVHIVGAGRSVTNSGVWSQGNTEELSDGRDFSRCKTSNVHVRECNPCLEINTYNTYLITNEDTMLERGDTLIRVNDGGINSGENIKFTGNGIFAVCNDVIQFDESCDVSFIGSSFDFVQGNPVFFNSGYATVRFNNTYFEKATHHGLARSSGSYFNMNVFLTDVELLTREYDGYSVTDNAGNNKIFTGDNVVYSCHGIRIKRELYNADPADYDLCSDEIRSITISGILRDQLRGQCLGTAFSSNINPNFELSNNADGIATTGVLGYVDSGVVGGYDWTIQNFVSYSTNKAIEATLDGTTSTFCDILTDKIPCGTNDTIVLGAKLHGGNSLGNIQVNSVVRFYDYNGNIIQKRNESNALVDDTRTLNHGNMLDYYNDTTSPLYTGNRTYWIGIPAQEINKIPSGAVAFDVKLVLSNYTNTVYIDDFCVNTYRGS